MGKKFILTAIILQTLLLAVFLFIGLTAKPRMEWEVGLHVPDYSGEAVSDAYAMLPVKEDTTNALWYKNKLTQISLNYLRETRAKTLEHEILTDTSALLKYRLFCETDSEGWVVWVDLRPLSSANTEPRIAVERASEGGGGNG